MIADFLLGYGMPWVSSGKVEKENKLILSIALLNNAQMTMHEILMGRELASYKGEGLLYKRFFYMAVELAWTYCYRLPAPHQAVSM